MQPGNYYQRFFECPAERPADVRRFVAQAAKDIGADDDAIFACQLAADEAAANAFHHAYAGQSGRVEVRVWRDGDEIAISMCDWGMAFDPAQVPDPTPEPGLSGRQAGGYGIFLMRRVMDEVSYTFHPRGGNTVTMRRRLFRSGY